MALRYTNGSGKGREFAEADMFLESKLKSKNPKTREKAAWELVVKTRKQASRGKGERALNPVSAADAPLMEFARTEKDPAVLGRVLSWVNSTQLLLTVARDEQESDFLRAASVREFVSRMQSRVRMALERGDNESAQQLLDVMEEDCSSILGSCSSEAVRAAVLEGLEGPEPEDLLDLLTDPVDAGKLFMYLRGERDPNRIYCIVEKLKSMEAPKDFSYVEGPFSIVMRNRESYPEHLVQQLIDVYAHWTNMSSKQVRLKFANRVDLDRLKENLNGDNVNQSICALDDLQEMYRLGTFRSEIAAMTYNGQSVPTYRDPNAGNIITAPTH